MSSSRKLDKELRMILIGRSGSGKSRTGNNILGKKCFEFGMDSETGNVSCSLNSANRFGYKIDIVETPGLFQVKRSMGDMKKEVKKSIIMTSPGPHVILLCVPMTRFGKEDTETLSRYVEFFGEDMAKYTMVLFTRLDIYEMDCEDIGITMSPDKYIAELPNPMRQFLSACNNRYMFINNRKNTSEDYQKLISTVVGMSRTTPSPYFTNESFQMIEEP